MPFTDFLKATVLLLAGEATALAAIAVLAAMDDIDDVALIAILALLCLAGLAGTLSGRRTRASTSIGGLLADARSQSSLPEIEPGSILLNRLWPLIPYAVAFAAVSFLYPQATGVGAAFLVFVALSWRRQEKAVTAIEERDGARFYVVKQSPWRRMQLVRTPGMKRISAKRGAT